MQCVCFTRVVCQRLGGPIFTWGDKVPDEALDVLIATVMQQAIGKEGSADCFHIHLLQGALEATMSEDVTPPTPPIDKHEKRGNPISLKQNIHNVILMFNSTQHSPSGMKKLQNDLSKLTYYVMKCRISKRNV